MSIVKWDDVTKRYSSLEKLTGGAEALTPAYIVPAEAEVTGRLAPRFTVPFSSNNVTFKDLVIDLVRAKGGSFKEEERKEMLEDIDSRLKRLFMGQEAMVTVDSAGAYSMLYADLSNAVWGSTQDYPPAFGRGEFIDFEVSSAQKQDELDATLGN